MLVSSILNAPEIQFAKKCFVGGITTLYKKGKNLPNMTNMELMKFVWLISHLLCDCGFLTSLWSENPLWYYISIGGAISTYTVAFVRHMLVLVHGNLAFREEIPLASLLNAENSLLLVAAWLHFTSSPNPLKLISFAIFSYMNLISFILHELISANSFTTALFPVLSCIEPLLLGFACFSDYCLQLLYYREYILDETPLLYGLIFSYISFKRLEKSELARVSLYSFFDMTFAILIKVRAPQFLLHLLERLQAFVYLLVPIQISGDSENVTRKTSVGTRATSIFFEPILIINDLN
ncbi:hypothetical protein METBIDRAFT_13749 [Metschnikowia bicuspidata var. bicuspidata NRRL YB-4993]|uniref:Uncharacterized protein n=1 Tax=Metschnikowia bicuspidata var. bicuspidata NRRL YB-4993 TaxID=869754 RepID=A0A1A0H4M2_9ASCO|nr:hypothetical protein METBIDRAFT_13749 [Metschnikowia bicuspidata var. bicuspidata NRRL YB-4993]OBA18986.1 hypothetical protein METBIDRAFT_13749 [Metschnikowia bicuspidata var. bicuspidata NRRL YB-4993]